MQWFMTNTYFKFFLLLEMVAILCSQVEHTMNFSVNLFHNSCSGSWEGSCLKVFLFFFCSGGHIMQLFEQVWLRVTLETLLWNNFKIHAVVHENKSYSKFGKVVKVMILFKAIVDRACRTHAHTMVRKWSQMLTLCVAQVSYKTLWQTVQLFV